MSRPNTAIRRGLSSIGGALVALVVLTTPAPASATSSSSWKSCGKIAVRTRSQPAYPAYTQRGVIEVRGTTCSKGRSALRGAFRTWPGYMSGWFVTTRGLSWDCERGSSRMVYPVRCAGFVGGKGHYLRLRARSR